MALLSLLLYVLEHFRYLKRKSFMPTTRSQAAAQAAIRPEHAISPEEDTEEPIPIYPNLNKRRATRQRSRSVPRLANPFSRVVEEETSSQTAASAQNGAVDPRVQSANHMLEVFGGLSRQLETLLKAQQEQQSFWERRTTQSDERLEALIQNLRVSPLASGNDRSTPVPTSQTSVRNITRNPAMSAQPLSEDEVQEKVLRITALLEENEVEIEVTWYLEKNGPLTAITWRGNPKAGNDDDGNPNLIVKYEKGDFPFPKDGVIYTRVHVVNQIPIMPGKIEDASEFEPCEEVPGKFVFHDVRTWNEYLRSVDQHSVDLLEHRIRIDLELPAIMTEDSAFHWSLLREWMLDAFRRGGIDLEDPHQASIGQKLLDKVRITQGVLRGADSTYVRTRYETQRSDDTLGNTIRQSISYGSRGRGRGRGGHVSYRGSFRGGYGATSSTTAGSYGRAGFRGRGSGPRS